MPGINIPMPAVLTLISFAGIALYADAKAAEYDKKDISAHDGGGNDEMKNGTYNIPVIDRLKNIFFADDFAALRAVCKIRDAYEDVVYADYSKTDCDMSMEHLKEVFFPVFPGRGRNMLVSFTDNFHKTSSLLRRFNSIGGKDTLSVLSEFADVFPTDALTNVLKMRDAFSAFSPFMSFMSSSPAKSGNSDEIAENISYIIGEDEDSPSDDEYEDVLELVRMMKK